MKTAVKILRGCLINQNDLALNKSKMLNDINMLNELASE